MIFVNLATTCLTNNFVVGSFELGSATIKHSQFIIIGFVATTSTVVIGCFHIIDIIKREQFAIKLGQRRDLFSLLQMDQYFL